MSIFYAKNGTFSIGQILTVTSRAVCSTLLLTLTARVRGQSCPKSPNSACFKRSMYSVKTIKYQFLLVVLSLKLSEADAKLCAGAGCDEVNSHDSLIRGLCLPYGQRCLYELAVSARQRVGTHTPIWSSRVRARIFEELDFLVVSGIKSTGR